MATNTTPARADGAGSNTPDINTITDEQINLVQIEAKRAADYRLVQDCETARAELRPSHGAHPIAGAFAATARKRIVEAFLRGDYYKAARS